MKKKKKKKKKKRDKKNKKRKGERKREREREREVVGTFSRRGGPFSSSSSFYDATYLELLHVNFGEHELRVLLSFTQFRENRFETVTHEGLFLYRKEKIKFGVGERGSQSHNLSNESISSSLRFSSLTPLNMTTSVLPLVFLKRSSQPFFVMIEVTLGLTSWTSLLVLVRLKRLTAMMTFLYLLPSLPPLLLLLSFSPSSLLLSFAAPLTRVVSLASSLLSSLLFSSLFFFFFFLSGFLLLLEFSSWDFVFQI